MGNPYIAEDIAMMRHFDDKEAQIRKSERERIIALLETKDLHAMYLFPQGTHAENCHVCAAIALIKGEN